MNESGDAELLEGLAKELHDDVGQTLTAIKLRIQSIIRDTESATPQATRESLEDVVPLIQEAIEEVRSVQTQLLQKAKGR